MRALLTKCVRSSPAGSRTPAHRPLFWKGRARFLVDQSLWLQASLDGELPDCQKQATTDIVVKHPDARLLLQELRMVASALASGEPERRVPQSRQSYWKEIERAIKKLEPGGTGSVLPGRRGSREGIACGDICTRQE
jgi:hypothetical protein